MKRQLKKSLSLFMAVIMFLSCWVWIAPHKAEAGVATQYYMRITTNVTDTGDEDGSKITINYKDTNGKGDTGTFTQSYGQQDWDGQVTVYEGPINGWPTSFSWQFDLGSGRTENHRDITVWIGGSKKTCTRMIAYCEDYNFTNDLTGTDYLNCTMAITGEVPVFTNPKVAGSVVIDINNIENGEDLIKTVSVTGGSDQYGVDWVAALPTSDFSYSITDINGEPVSSTYVSVSGTGSSATLTFSDNIRQLLPNAKIGILYLNTKYSETTAMSKIIFYDGSYLTNYDIDSDKLVNELVDCKLINSDFNEFHNKTLDEAFDGEQIFYGPWQYDYVYKNTDGTTTYVKEGDEIKNFRELLISSVVTSLWNGSLQTSIFKLLSESVGGAVYNFGGAAFDVVVATKDGWQWLPEILHMAIPTMPHDYVENWTNPLTGEGHAVYSKISEYTVDWYKYFTGDAFGAAGNAEYDYQDLLYVLDKAPLDTTVGTGVEARSYWKPFTYGSISNDNRSEYKQGDAITSAKALNPLYWSEGADNQLPFCNDGVNCQNEAHYFNSKDAWHINDWNDFYRTFAVATCGLHVPLAEFVTNKSSVSEASNLYGETDVLGLDTTLVFETESEDFYNSFMIPLYKALGIEEYDKTENPLGYRSKADFRAVAGTYATGNGRVTVASMTDSGVTFWQYILEPIINWMENELFVNPLRAVFNALPGIFALLEEFDIADNFDMKSYFTIKPAGISVTLDFFESEFFKNSLMDLFSNLDIELSEETKGVQGFFNSLCGAKRTRVAPSVDNIFDYLHIDNDKTKDVYRDKFGYYYTNVGVIAKKVFALIDKAYFDWLQWEEDIGSLSFEIPIDIISSILETSIADYEDYYIYSLDALRFWLYYKNGFEKIQPLFLARKEILSLKDVLSDKESLELKHINLLLSMRNYAYFVEYTDKHLIGSDEAHIWNSGELVCESNCSVGGIKLYTCTDCGITKRQAIESLPHDNRIHYTYKADCINDGKIEYVCNNCGLMIVEPSGEKAAGHCYREEIIEPTCKSDGYTKHICEKCNDEYTDNYVAVVDHKYTQEHFDATDEKDSYTLYTCVYCGKNYEVIDPATPVEGLQAFAGTYTVSLSWLKSVEASVTGYKVYRKLITDTEYTLIKTISSRNTTSFVDKGLTAGYEYVYVVTALKDDVEGLNCDPVTCIPNADEEEPRILKLEPSKVINDVINGIVKFSINAEDNIGVVKFELYYSVENSGEWKLISEYKGASANISFNTKSVSDGIYSFKAIAYDAIGNSGDGSIVKTYTVDNTGPDKVTGINTKAVYASKATIAWNNVSDKDINHFILRRKTDTGYTTVSNSISGVLGYNLEGLLPNTQYTYSVAGVDHYGNVGEYSDDFSFITLADTTVPVITSLLPASGRYNGSISFKATATDDCGIASIIIQTSFNGNEWENIKTYTYSDNKSSKTCIYTVPLQNCDDGALYIRAISNDTSGNCSVMDKTAPFIQYYVDKTAPAAPSGIVAVGGDGYIQIKWNRSSEGDLGGYYVYRSTTENGTFTKISNKLTTLNHYDRNVNRDTTYYYKVEAIDTCGNVSEQSVVVSAKALSDTVKPTIESISPAYGSAISANNNQIGILANDNNMLKRIVVEYKYDSDYKVLKTFDIVNSSNKVVYVSLPVSSYNHSDVVYLRAYCVDAAGYTSEYSSAVKYTIDKVAPGLTNLSCVINDGVCTLKWNDTKDSDLSGFKVYRSSDGGSYKSIGSRAYSSSHLYTFNDTVSEGTHTYRIDCVDKSGNSASYYSDSVNWTKPAQIKAVITSETYLEQGVQEVFRASSSTSDNSITSYLWDFGDGSTSNKINVTKSYNEAGVYTVTLKIIDDEGNISTASKLITVAERELLGTARVRVVNENGYAISNAPVYFDLGEENQQIVYTNTSGYASLTMTVGTHVVGSYKNGFLPVSGNVTVLANTTAEITLTMVEQELITGEFEVHEMTFEEIKAAGIDVNDPANQQIYEVKVTLIYGEEKIPVTYVRNDTEIISYTIGNTGGAGPGGGGGGGNHGGGKINHISFVPNEMNQEIIAVVEIPITASYLKQFYSANLHIVNNAAAGYEIVNCEANISVPDGLTVVQHTPISSVIDGQQSSSANWILRGDKAGSYNLSANFSGVLDSFNVPVSASFTADEPVVVYGPDSVKLRIEVQEEIEEKLFFNVCLVNNRSVNVNRPRINVSNFVYNITEYYKKNLSAAGISKEDIEAIENTFLRMGVISADGKATFYDVTDPEENPVDVLGPGETLVYEFCVNEVTDYPDTGYFNRAIVECDDYYATSIEVVVMSDMPLSITEDQFIKEHLEFIISDSFREADTDFPRRISDGLKESFEDDWYEFIELDYFTNYAEIVVADYILQKPTYDALEMKFLELFATETASMYSNLAKIVMEEYLPSASDLTANKIVDIFSGAQYDTAAYKHLNKAFTDMKIIPERLKSETIKIGNNIHYGLDTVATIYDLGSDTIDAVKKTVTYLGAISAYKKCTNVYFKNILEGAVNNLSGDSQKLKEAIEDFTNTDSTGDYILRLGEEIIGTTVSLTAQNLLTVFKDAILSNVANYTAKALGKLAKLLKFAEDSDDYKALTNIGGSIVIGYELGVAISKIIANTGDLNVVMSQLTYYCQLATSLETVLFEKRNNFIDEPNFENALYFDSAFKAFKNAWLSSAQLFAEYAKEKNDALAVQIFSKDKFKDNIADAVNRVTVIKQLYCHNVNHYVDTTSSKIAMVECPVDVYVYDDSGNLLAKVTDTETIINDQFIYVASYEGKKFVSMPSGDEYNIRIVANDTGTMDYTVLEYSSDINIRRVIFEDIALEKGDVFEGNVDSVLFTDKDNYALTKNDNDVIIATEDVEHQVTGITLDHENVTVQCGESIELNATVEPVDAENTEITWSSYDETIATVSESGVVKALKPGEVVVKAVTEDGGYVACCTVMVECSNHKYGQWSITEQPSCKTEGKQTRVCGYCEYVDDQILEKLKHTGGVATCKDQKICSLCNEPYGELDSNNHAPLDAVVENEIPSKCGIKGSYDLVTYCSFCEKELSREVKETESLKHKNKTVVGKAPTCTEIGLTDGTICLECGTTITEQNIIAKLNHKDDNDDYKCDYGCGYKFEKPVQPEHSDEPSYDDCGHLCHKGGFIGFIWKIVRFFWKLFKMNPVCECGAKHY